MTLASVDWWARGFGIAGAVAGAASLIWNVYTWRKPHHVSIKARSHYNLTEPGGPSLTIKLRNRGAAPVTVDDVKRQHAHRARGRWRPYNEEEAQVIWNTSNDQPIPFPLVIPPKETYTMRGIDQLMVQRTNTAWRFRLVVTDAPRFNVRRRRLWPAKWHRSSSG